MFKISVLFFVAFLAINPMESQTKLKLLYTYTISGTVAEPSGLTFDKANNQLFAVSDSDDIYRLSVNGTLLERYSFSGDLEGVSMYDTPSTLLLAVENSRQLVTYNYLTGQTVYHAMDYENKGEIGVGIEGVTYNPTTQELYFVNEKDPGALIIANRDFEVTQEYVMTIAEDYSAMYYVEETGVLWLGSDDASRVYKCNTQGGVLESLALKTASGDDLDKLEGMAIDHQNQLLYVVTDAGGELMVYEIDDASLGIKAHTPAETAFRIHPIPTDSILNIDRLDGAQKQKLKDIALYNVLGKRVKSFRSDLSQLDVSDLNSGIYFLSLITLQDKKYMKRINIK